MNTPARFRFTSSDGLSIADVKWEMLHETNRRDVITNLLVWIAGVLNKAS
jgi:hypothetical protein